MKIFIPALLIVLLPTACGPEGPGSETLLAPLPAPIPGRSDLRIGVVGAGASGLTAALTLKERGYSRVTVFEKESQVGGKVRSLRIASMRAELGAVFTSSDYELVLGLADRTQSPIQLMGTLASDVLNLGKGLFVSPIVQKEWEYFPRVDSRALADGFYDGVDGLQGRGGVYFVGSALSFETVEHTARFARSLVRAHFPAVP